jgi:hypothetical protein
MGPRGKPAGDERECGGAERQAASLAAAGSAAGATASARTQTLTAAAS